jgi:hypothetical protein
LTFKKDTLKTGQNPQNFNCCAEQAHIAV